ncbi:MAG: hypothetical protein WDW36_004879 [Sanguina aurantia]
MPQAPLTTKPATARRAVGYWATFNLCWREQHQALGRRPTRSEVGRWYDAHADGVWGDDKPAWLAFRDHAKCLRLTDDVRNYFKAYRKKKAEIQTANTPAAAPGATASLKRSRSAPLPATAAEPEDRKPTSLPPMRRPPPSNNTNNNTTNTTNNTNNNNTTTTTTNTNTSVLRTSHSLPAPSSNTILQALRSQPGAFHNGPWKPHTATQPVHSDHAQWGAFNSGARMRPFGEVHNPNAGSSSWPAPDPQPQLISDGSWSSDYTLSDYSLGGDFGGNDGALAVGCQAIDEIPFLHDLTVEPSTASLLGKRSLGSDASPSGREKLCKSVFGGQPWPPLSPALEARSLARTRLGGNVITTDMMVSDWVPDAGTGSGECSDDSSKASSSGHSGRAGDAPLLGQQQPHCSGALNLQMAARSMGLPRMAGGGSAVAEQGSAHQPCQREQQQQVAACQSCQQGQDCCWAEAQWSDVCQAYGEAE